LTPPGPIERRPQLHHIYFILKAHQHSSPIKTQLPRAPQHTLFGQVRPDHRYRGQAGNCFVPQLPGHDPRHGRDLPSRDKVALPQASSRKDGNRARAPQTEIGGIAATAGRMHAGFHSLPSIIQPCGTICVAPRDASKPPNFSHGPKNNCHSRDSSLKIREGLSTKRLLVAILV